MPEEKGKKGERGGVREVEKRGREGGGRNWDEGKKLTNKWTNRLINDCLDKCMNGGKKESIERKGGWVGEGRKKRKYAKRWIGRSKNCKKGMSKRILDKWLFITLKICFRVCSADEGILNMLKWRRNLGVTGFLPPPGGAQAAQMVMSYPQETTRASKKVSTVDTK